MPYTLTGFRRLSSVRVSLKKKKRWSVEAVNVSDFGLLVLAVSVLITKLTGLADSTAESLACALTVELIKGQIKQIKLKIHRKYIVSLPL